MRKKTRKILIALVSVVVSIGLVVGGLVVYRNINRSPVNVYDVSNFAMTDYWGDQSEAYGMVRLDKIQQVNVSPTQTITEIYVTEGQSVKVGDPILAYDTTLSDIDLEKAEINFQKLELQKQKAERELETIKTMTPYSQVLVVPESQGVTYTPVATPVVVSGEGTMEDPYYYLWGENDVLKYSQLEYLYGDWLSKHQNLPAPDAEPLEEETPEDTEEGAEENTPANADKGLYIAFITRYANALNAPITSSWGLRVEMVNGELQLKHYEPVLSEDILAFEEEPQPYYESYGSPYSAAEIAELRASKEQEIADLEISIKMAEVDLERLRQEVNDGLVLSTLDGIVKSVGDPDWCAMTGEPVITVSAGGGYYIDVAMSELELDSMVIGQTVTVNSWETGMVYDGTVVAISEYPSENAETWTQGNNNVSFYPFTVFVDEDAELRQYSYVSVTYEASNQNDFGSMYLENMFIRNEGGRSFCYVVGENGLLEERTIQVGKSLWGSYTQIRGGLSLEDKIAFPYGKDTVAGAKCKDADIDEFYQSMYGSYY